MSTPILTTKLHVPDTPTDRVGRPHLDRILDGLTHGRLAAIVAGPAYGKTTLAAAWLQQQPMPNAWLSLDEGDNDPPVFLAYLVAVFRRVYGDIGASVLAALQAHPLPSLRPLLVNLLNAIDASGIEGIVVLDDYHLIRNRMLHEALDYLLTHQPPGLHLAILSRTALPLSLPLLRGRGQLVEIGEADLAFSLAESAHLFQESMGLALEDDDVAQLTARTEGWVGGLQMAALALRGCDDVHEGLSAYTGQHHLVAEYLMDQVLSRQPRAVQRFLTRTSILEPFCADLCDAIEAAEPGQSDALIRDIERRRLFLVPLDSEHHWFRYHRLFGAFMRRRLVSHEPEVAADVRRRASAWCEARGMVDESIAYALDGREYGRAVELIDRVAVSLISRNEHGRLLRWMDRLPDGLVRQSPRLSLVRARAIGSMRGDRAAPLLNWIQAHHGGVGDPPVRGCVAALRALAMVAAEDRNSCLDHVELALRELSDDSPDELVRSLRCLALWARGRYWFWAIRDLARADLYLEEGLRDAQRIGDGVLTGLFYANLGSSALAQGEVRRSERILRKGLMLRGLPPEQGGIPLMCTDYMELQVSAVLYRLGELDEAEQHLMRAIELGELVGSWKLRHSRQRMAYIKLAQGDPAAAWEHATRCAELSDAHSPQDSTWARSELVYLSLRMMGDGLDHGYSMEDVRRWVASQGHGLGEHLSGDAWSCQSTLTLALIALGRPEEALRRLDHLMEQGRPFGETLRSRTVLLHQALALDALGDREAALGSLVRALAGYTRDGVVFPVAHYGRAMKALLRAMADRGDRDPGVCPVPLAYVEMLLAYPWPGDRARQGLAREVGQGGEALGTSRPVRALVEPLTAREREVLDLLAQGLTNKRIAERLVVSAHTVGFHTRNIYGKLGVHTRGEAVAAARELGLI